MNNREICFDREMQHARRMRPMDEEYWGGYSIGLLNGLLHCRAIPRALHSSMLERAASDGKSRGYSAGFRRMAEVEDDADPSGPLAT